MKKKILSIMLVSAMFMTFGLAGCGKTADETATGTNTPVSEEQKEEEISAEPETAVSEDTAILVVSFGTSYNDSREVTIGAIENAIQEAHPEYEVRRAFTSQIIIDKLAERDGLEIDNVTEALDRAVADGIKNLIVQPTHLMNGLEYTDLVDELSEYEEDFDQIVVGDPLLTSEEDYTDVITAITDATSEYDDGQTAIVFMGHGTEAESNHVYADLQEKLTAAGFENYYVGTVEATPALDDIVAALKEKGNYTKVVLEPLMVVAGDHANNDMAGDEEDSWKTSLEAEGFEVECLIHGLGENEAIRQIYVNHVQAAIDGMTE